MSDGKGGPDETQTAKDIFIAVGGRPTYLDVPGSKEFCITSDDLFWLQKAPGKTLVIGAGYIAMECGGFLQGMGYETHLMVRSVPLRQFDQEMVERVVQYMKDEGVKFLSRCNPVRFEKTEDGKVLVTWLDENGQEQ